MKRILLGFSLLLSLSLSAQSWQGKPVVRIQDVGQSFQYTFSDSSDAYINKCNVSYIVNMPNSQWVQLGYMYDGSTSRIITASFSAITQPDLGSAKELSDTLNAWLRDCAGTGGGGGGGSTDSIYLFRTYAQLRAQMSAHTLIKGATYKLTDFATIYDQSLSGVTKTASGEIIVLVANSDSTFSPIVSSLDFPTDIIHYDITIDTTYVNGAPCKGKITYRKDVNGNSTYFDFRKVLMINYNDSTEQLFFDLSKLITGNDMPFTKEYGLSFGIDAIEFPASFFKDNVYQNSNNYFAASYFNGEVTQNTGNTILASNFGGEFSQNFELRIIECVFDSILIYSGEGSWSNSIFHSAVNKVVSTNFNYTEVDGLIDRIFQSGYLYDTIQGRLYWCVGIYMYACNIDGDFSGVNECAWVQTRSNCNIETINGISHQSEKIGFKDCTITGTSSSSDFGNIRIDCLVESKIISEALYPELFDTSYAKTIFKGSNGSVYYTYYNGLTYVINEII